MFATFTAAFHGRSSPLRLEPGPPREVGFPRRPSAAAQGHEIASHTVDHVRLGGLSAANETYQYDASKAAKVVNGAQDGTPKLMEMLIAELKQAK